MVAGSPPTTLREYHERTKHSLASVRGAGHVLDWDNQPLPFKVYPDLAPTPLPTDLPGSQRPVLDAIAGSARPPFRPLDLPALAHLLYFSAGVLRVRQHAGGSIYYRAAACTGALHHVDLYPVTAALADLPAGVHHFGPHDFAMTRLRDGDHRGALIAACGDEPHVRAAPALVVLASTIWRNAWKYRSRAYRHAFWDAGTILANLLAAAAALDVPAHVVTGFTDDAVARLLDLDTTREAPLAVVALGDGAPPPPAAPPISPLHLATLPLSATEVDYPLVREAHLASSLTAPEAVGRWRMAAPAVAPPSRPTAVVPTALAHDAIREPIEAVIVRRGSARRFTHASIPLVALATVLDAARAPSSLDAHAPSTIYLIANAVDDLDPGAYVVGADGGLAPIRLGAFRREAGFLGLGQELPADAAADLYWLVDLEPVFARLGDRGYRVAQLEAAIAGGRTYLAAYALGLGATGLTFFDDDVTQFFSPDAAGTSVMFHMALGRTPPRRRAGG
jgi:SagB-type dehydrogenase family enzyme